MVRLFRQLLLLTGKAGLARFIFLGLLSGASSFLFINFVNKSVGYIIAGHFEEKRLQYTALFAAVILLFVVVRRVLSLGLIRLSQTLFWNIRKQIIGCVLNSNYRQLFNKKADIQAAMTNDVNLLTTVSLSIIGFFTAFILAIASLVYLASISFVLFLITLVVAGAGSLVYHFSAMNNNERLKKGHLLERDFFRSMDTILDGFKEIYMEPKKGKAVYDEKIKRIAKNAYRNNVSAFTGFLNNQIIGQVLFYILIASILLFFSFVLKIKSQDIVSFVFTLLYLLGALETILTTIPVLSRAMVSSDRLLDLTENLRANSDRNRIPKKYMTAAEFDSIVIKALQFKYGETAQDFSVGPVNFDLRKGEVVFIYGGNGSGKTTFMQALTGLHIPDAGEIRLNGLLVTNENYPEYRSCFSVVFSDFYLFDELFGWKNPDQEKFLYYLRLFELEGKVTLEGNRFSTTDLSMGQRKRLALIASLLEDKPLLILDEWAADQDPYFRKKFYTEIIPLLKQSGITIIAITHDDKYYHCADRVYKMEYGKLMEKPVGEYAVS
ncbi:hypothetical protein A4H97_22235 [Niastella yeongjuensis]|uniref:Cyclic peptide transporter n=1 Tax=Niastella yeongjuensis TaxID=354355 RepID=A0A1V9F743_9BACT|nr:cyclic peptide export ABC transporter [Niastella yeongjuensis]OQP54219.1 hypothetical protein A4H97_22235 [Niastella yeongjuensis]SEP31772.1 putative ATP-binding cassette transporter [Niastella yeongjuensis]